MELSTERGSIADAPEHHDDHDHAHHHHPEVLPLSKTWKRATVLGNLTLGVLGTWFGVDSGSLSEAALGVHDTGDALVFHEHIENASNEDRTEEKRERRRKLSQWAISLSCLGISAKAGYDIMTDHEGTPTLMNGLLAGASMGLSGTLYASLHYRMKQAGVASIHTKELAKHFLFVDLPSAALALGGVALQHAGLFAIEQHLAVASGLMGAAAFNPFSGHNHGSKPDADATMSARDVWRQDVDARMIARANSWAEQDEHPVVAAGPKREAKRFTLSGKFKRAAAIGAAAVALHGGLMVADDFIEGSHNHSPSGSVGILEEPVEVPVEMSSDCVMVQDGDSQWRMAQRRFSDVMGLAADDSVTSVLVDSMTDSNHIIAPDKDKIMPGDCLRVPTVSEILQAAD